MRWVVTAMLFCLCGLLAETAPAPQEKEDPTRLIWNMHFQAARAKKPPKSTPALGRELIGVTIWRLNPSPTSGNPDAPRVPVQEASGAKKPYLPERVKAETSFKEGELVRLGIELPRGGKSYLYVIDHEEYADGTTSEPYLILPGATMPTGGNVMTPGEIAYVPAQGDPIPYFTLRPSRKDQVSEKLTIIVSPKPLRFSISEETQPSGAKMFRLETRELARLEREWGGPTEHREEKGGEGKAWTTAEKEAGEGRKLTQEGPLPQTIYRRVKPKPGAPVLITVPLRIAR
jgi:hypothetical protein